MMQTPTWKLSQLQRDAVSKRVELDALNAQLAGLETMLSEAHSFTGHFNQRLAVAERRVSEVSTCFAKDGTITQKGDPAEHERRSTELNAILRERDAEMARRTTTATYGLSTLRFCTLRPADVIRKRGQVVIVRDRIARELSTIEAQMSPGEIVQSGVEAGEYADHRQRVEALRARLA